MGNEVDKGRVVSMAMVGLRGHMGDAVVLYLLPVLNPKSYDGRAILLRTGKDSE